MCESADDFLSGSIWPCGTGGGLGSDDPTVWRPEIQPAMVGKFGEEQVEDFGIIGITDDF